MGEAEGKQRLVANSWERHLLETVNGFRHQGQLCDVNIVTEGGMVCMAHSCVLAVTSQVLKARIQQDMDIGLKCHYIKTDIPGDVLPHVLQFIYTGSIGVEPDIAPLVTKALEGLGVAIEETVTASTLTGLDQYRTKGLFCDMNIIASDNTIFMTHAPILAAASQIIRARIVAETQKGLKCLLLKTNVEKPILGHVLRFIYTGVIDVETGVMPEVQKALESLGVVLENKDEEPQAEKAPTKKGVSATPTSRDVQPKSGQTSDGHDNDSDEDYSPSDDAGFDTVPPASQNATGSSGGNPNHPVTSDGEDNDSDGDYSPSDDAESNSDFDTVGPSQAHHQGHPTSQQPPQTSPKQTEHVEKPAPTRRKWGAGYKYKEYPNQHVAQLKFKITKSSSKGRIGAYYEHEDYTTKTYKCSLCGLEAESRAALDDHLQTHATKGKRLHHCDQCGHASFSRQDITEHKKTDHKPKKLQCKHCPRVFEYEVAFLEHRKTHTDKLRKGLDKPKVCKTCGKEYTILTAFYAHRAKHKMKTEICSVCGKSFLGTRALKGHERTHNKEYKFQCPHCDQKFWQKNLVDAHIRSAHTGDKPYPCEYCPKGFGGSGSRLRHMRRMHPEHGISAE